MKAVAMVEARNRFAELLAAVEHGEEVTITRHGAPVARLISVQTSAQPPFEQRQRVAAAMQRLQALSSGAELGCSLQQALHEGRD